MIKHYRTLLLVFALFCNTVVIQAQNVSLKLNNVTVKEAIEAVKKQTGKSFFFNVNDVDLNHRVNIDLKDAPLGKALSQILQGQDIDYEVKDNHIVLSKRNSTKNNQTFTVVGQVTDEKGMPLIGVNITAKGHGNTVTDIDGNYSIKAAPGIALVFSYIGYLQESVKVNKQKTVNVQMTEDTKALNEVVVIGYGTQKKANLTGAVDAISSKEIEDRPVSNLGRALQGAVPNLNITYGSGKPNEGHQYPRFRLDQPRCQTIGSYRRCRRQPRQYQSPGRRVHLGVERCILGGHIRCKSLVRCNLGNHEKRKRRHGQSQLQRTIQLLELDSQDQFPYHRLRCSKTGR